MPLNDLRAGATASGSVTVGPEHFASRIFRGAPDVFSTPDLGGLVEATAAGLIQQHLDPGQMTVGTNIVINHTAATPPGLSVTVTVEVASVEGRRVDFTWSARDEREEVGSGTHQRFVVDAERFMKRLNEKRL
jgi:fluoroacetyl-CoA thioesterase